MIERFRSLLYDQSKSPMRSVMPDGSGLPSAST